MLHPGTFLQSFLDLNGLERLEDGRPVIVSSPSQFGFIRYFLVTGPGYMFLASVSLKGCWIPYVLPGSLSGDLSSAGGGDFGHFVRSASFLCCKISFFLFVILEYFMGRYFAIV